MNKSWFKICIWTSNLCCSSSSIKLDVNIKVKIGMMPEAISCTDGLIQSIARLGKIIFSILVNFGPYPEVLVNCFQHLGYYSVMDQFLHWYLHLNYVKGDKYISTCMLDLWTSRPQELNFNFLQIGFQCLVICFSVLLSLQLLIKESSDLQRAYVTPSSPVWLS